MSYSNEQPMTNPTAAVLVIGDEILSGRTPDQNINFLAKRLHELGILLKEGRIIADDESSICEAVNNLRKSYTYVFTTGGIGGTHDDITAQSLAKAFGRPFVENPQALAILKEYYQENLNAARRRMALMPENVTLIPNPVSMAPGFKIENVFAMAGVPSIMQAMFEGIIPYLQKGPPLYTVTLRTFTIAENTLADELACIQRAFQDASIGSYPFFRVNQFGVCLVLRSTGKTRLLSASQAVEELIKRHGGQVEREES